MIPISKPFLTKEEAQSAFDTILSGWVTQGPKVEEFENESDIRPKTEVLLIFLFISR